MAFKDSKENFNQVWDEVQGKWIPKPTGMVAFDTFTNTYKPVMGVLSNKSPGSKYTRLALTMVDANGNPIGWAGSSKPIFVRQGVHWSSDCQNGYQAGTGDNSVIPLSTVTNPSGFTLANVFGGEYWVNITNIIVSNASGTGVWLRLLQLPVPSGNPEIARFWCPPNDTRIYQGNPLIKGAVSGSPRFILALESCVDTVWVSTLHYQDLFWG